VCACGGGGIVEWALMQASILASARKVGEGILHLKNKKIFWARFYKG
jgi:hypothetical protein